MMARQGFSTGLALIYGIPGFVYALHQLDQKRPWSEAVFRGGIVVICCWTLFYLLLTFGVRT